MNKLTRYCCFSLALAALLCGAPVLAQGKPLAKPADLKISVSPKLVAAGEEAHVVVLIEPVDGVKINKYPKIKLKVPAQAGLVAEGFAEIGNAKPPPPDQMETNYYKGVDPLDLTLQMDAGAKSGTHEIDAKLTYFYCVAASGFCAPARVPIKIPVAVR